MSVMWTRLPNLSATFAFWVHGFLSYPMSASKADGTQKGIRARTTNTFWGENKRHWVLHCYVELLIVGSGGSSRDERSTQNRLGAFYEASSTAMKRGQHGTDWVPSMKLAPAVYESFWNCFRSSDQLDFELGNYTKLAILKIYNTKQNHMLA